MQEKSEPILIGEAEIQKRVAEMGAQISADYRGQAVTAVGVLTGCFIFMADLLRALDETVSIDVQFISVSSYQSGTVSTGELRILLDFTAPLEGKNVLIVEDIVDTGLTLSSLRDAALARGARTVRIAALLDKEAKREKEVTLDYVGFRIPNRFVVGYGLDFDGRYRNLKEVRILDAH